MIETSDVSKKYYTYTLYSLKDNKLYTGFTSNLHKRINQHFKGLVKSTKHRLPLKLIHAEYYVNKKDAKAREVYLKSGFGRKQLLKSLQNTIKSL